MERDQKDARNAHAADSVHSRAGGLLQRICGQLRTFRNLSEQPLWRIGYLRHGFVAPYCVVLHISEGSGKRAAANGTRHGRSAFVIIAALILALSSVALLQFFMSYCRSVIAASMARPLSEQVWEVTGILDRQVRGEEFIRLLQLMSLCPDTGTDDRAISSIRAYFRMVSFARTALRGVVPGIVSWAEAELSGCAHFAAVALDSRISHSRELMAQQFSSQS